jgi:hypothetical protein
MVVKSISIIMEHMVYELINNTEYCMYRRNYFAVYQTSFAQGSINVNAEENEQNYYKHIT